MTIKNIAKLTNFGIFKNYNNLGVHDFGKYNLFYGWNGSGKSTFSKLFRCLEKGSLSDEFPLTEFTINTEQNATITKANINSSNLNIYTFNEDFITENISWNERVKSILLVDKEKIQEANKLDQLKKENETDAAILAKLITDASTLESSISKFGTDSARRLKSSLQAIDTSDKYYLNYDKRKFEAFISDADESQLTEASLLSDELVTTLTNSARPDLKPSIPFAPKVIDLETFSKAQERLNDLLKTSVISQAIKRLADNSDISKWVEDGLSLHKTHDSDMCEYCGNIVKPERINELEAHFNNAYKAFQDRLAKANEWLTEQYAPKPLLPVMGDLYEEFRKDYADKCAALGDAIDTLNAEINSWHDVLKEKITNPLDTRLIVGSISGSSITTLNNVFSNIAGIIGQHNHKSENFETETKKAKKRLELHYVVSEMRSFELDKRNKELKDLNAARTNLNSVMNSRGIEIRAIESSLSNENIGAGQFNDALHKFLGRGELTLRFDASKKGYEILRNDSDLVKGKLSEGEKTAIAFVYFITKLKENGNKMDNTIIVVDDPVCSFDSNHLFHAYSFLRQNCQNAKQIFILTHNFTYFKLVRDWFDGINKHRKRKTPPKDVNAFFYTIESTTTLPRYSQVKNADASLINYNSEYHYIFAKLYEYREKNSLTRDEAFLSANLSRKLLESFFTFKYPKFRTDFSQLMAAGLKGCETTDDAIKEKIYRFINKYSHSAVIEVNEDSSENLVGESHNVIGDIFVWINEVDATHYDEMIKVLDDQ